MSHEPTPATRVDLDQLEIIKLKGSSTEKWFAELRGIPEPQAAANYFWSIGVRLAYRVPVQMTIEAVVAELRANQPAALDSRVVAAITRRLSRFVRARQRSALSNIALSADIASRHRVERHNKLPSLTAEQYRGVILVAAPMGARKTLDIGAPFSAYAQAQTDGRFLAIVHRRSLVAELARVLVCDHYGRIDSTKFEDVRGLATCLPSIVKGEHQALIDSTRFVFLDEVAQVLRSLTSGVTVADRKTSADVYRRLVEIVRGAECVIAADATMDNRVVAFLEGKRCSWALLGRA